jgi:hypothetical protein
MLMDAGEGEALDDDVQLVVAVGAQYEAGEMELKVLSEHPGPRPAQAAPATRSRTEAPGVRRSRAFIRSQGTTV